MGKLRSKISRNKEQTKIFNAYLCPLIKGKGGNQGVLPVQFYHPEAEVPLVEHDDLVLVRAVVHHMPAGGREG